jgi:hypothetical protein
VKGAAVTAQSRRRGKVARDRHVAAVHTFKAGVYTRSLFRSTYALPVG